MTMAAPPAGRRSFLRSAAAAALTVVTVGTQAVFGAAPARAAYSCCLLVAKETPWCPLLCREQNHRLRCWSCNDNTCKCCECSSGANCYEGFSMCAYMIGCCEQIRWW